MRVALVYLNNDTCSVSRGPGYIASVVLSAGHALKFFDTAYICLERVRAEVTSGEYDILLISASSLFYTEATTLAAAVKQTSDIPILLGGIHATIIQGEILNECPDIDYICIGEGEGFIVDFLESMASGGMVKSIDNLGYRDDDGTAQVNPIRPCTDLKTLPPFRFDLFRPESIVNGYPKPGFCYVYATRGCPYNCSYCCNGCNLALYKRSYLRTQNIDTIIAELLFLKKTYPVELFYFGDEMILFNERFVTDLFRRIKTEVDVDVGCMVRVETITPAIVALFQETGCRYVGMGIECGDEAFRRKFLNRHMTNDQIIDAFRMLRAIPGMILTSYNMRGFPVAYDTELTRKTTALNARCGVNIVQTSLFYPFRGTKLYDYCIDNDLIDPVKLAHVHANHQDYFTESVLRPISGTGTLC